MGTYENDKKIIRKFNKLSNELKNKPNPYLIKNCFNAFIIGGSICVIGQLIKDIMIYLGMSNELAGMYLPIIMIFIGALLTGLGIYDKIATIAGAGTLVPITGFSNAMVSPAIEHKREGYILGIGSNMFKIAGPVLVFGIGSSMVLGIIFYILLKLGVVV